MLQFSANIIRTICIRTHKQVLSVLTPRGNQNQPAKFSIASFKFHTMYACNGRELMFNATNSVCLFVSLLYYLGSDEPVY